MNAEMYSLTGGMEDMSVTAALHYLVMAVPLAIIFALIFTVLGRNVEIDKESQNQ